MSSHREANTFALPRGLQNYATPAAFKAALDAFYHFTRNLLTGEDYDPCPLNPEGIRTADGLGPTPEWVKSYFGNPPYGNVTPWLDKAIEDRRRKVTACLLLRVDCSTAWMHDKVFPYARPIWVRGRLRFIRPGETKPQPSPFASVVAAYEPGISFPPQKVMWEDGEGWHLSEVATRMDT